MAWIGGNRYLSQTEMENNASIVWNYLGSKGWTLNAVSAILGNMQSESTINPNIWESLTVDYSRGYGLVQWTPASKYIDWAGADWENGDKELDRIIYEVDNGLQWFSNPNAPIVNPPITFKEFTTSTEPPETLADYFLWYYEHPAITIQPNRSEQAITWFNFLGGEFCPVVVPRLNSDGMLNNPYWYSLNPFYQSGYGLPNCTCYAWGRRYEITGKAPDTSLGNADKWFDYAVSHGQKTGQTPKAGSIMVWKYTGSHANDGGHVAIVEEVDGETVVTSNSAYGGTYFYTQTLSPPYEWASYTQFQGFIYLDCSIVPPKPSDKKGKLPIWAYCRLL